MKHEEHVPHNAKLVIVMMIVFILVMMSQTIIKEKTGSESDASAIHEPKHYMPVRPTPVATDAPDEEYSKSTTTPNTSYSNSTQSHTKSQNDLDDPYDVHSYDAPEDFYEDNRDDFEDYEDAENYYEENGN